MLFLKDSFLSKIIFASFISLFSTHPLHYYLSCKFKLANSKENVDKKVFYLLIGNMQFIFILIYVRK